VHSPKDKFSVIKFSSSITDLLKIPHLLSFDLSPNGKFIIYSSNETGNPQLHLLHVKAGSKPRQLTSGKDPVFRGRISPRGDRLVFPKDKDGNETFHMYLAPIEGGKPQQITRTPYRMWGRFDWHPKGKEIMRTVATMDKCGLESINVDTGECFMLKENTPPIGIVQYSPDGKWIACDAQTSAKSEKIYVVNRDDPSDIIVYGINEDSRDIAPSWSLNDKKLAFTSDAKGSRQVIVQDFQGKDKVFLELDREEQVPEYRQPLWSPRSEKVYYIVSKHSRTTVHGHAIDGKKEDALPFPEGTVDFIRNSNDGRIFALHSSMNSPWQVYLHELGSTSVIPLIPKSYNFDLTRLAKPESVWYKSFDGHRIHGWYMPAASGTTPHPAVLYVHGGPWMQVSDEWFDSDFLHCLSQSGFAVFAPNFRGSTGYGAEFQRMDIGDLGGGDLEDAIVGAEWLRKQIGIDSSKIAIMGASYGGYLTLLALTKKLHVFVAGVSIVPITDWLEMHELSDAAFRAGEEMLWGGPISEKKELLKDRSPITHVSKIKAPLMIMAGKGDARCPIQPIEKFVEKLKEMNHPLEFVLEEKAGHITTIFRWEEKIPIFKGIINYLKKALT
jgi:dipeptidyl aminopeptidase/acylaminoacyl peptidase